MNLRESLDRPVADYMSTDFPKVGPDDTVKGAAESMKAAGATEALVVDKGEPLGIVTERDIVYKVVASGSDPSSVKVRDVMSSPVETVENDAKVIDAIGKMSKLGVRRLGVTAKGKLVGMLTQKTMISGDLNRQLPLPELAHPDRVSCPYCGATMKDVAELSRHIDQVHLGLGLLEGDRTKW